MNYFFTKRFNQVSITFWLLILPIYGVTAQIAWTGATNSDWNTSGNWSTGTVPTATDKVIVPNVTPSPVLSTSTAAFSVEVSVGASLSITTTGSLVLNGSTTIALTTTTVSLYNWGKITNAGQISIGNLVQGAVAYGFCNRGVATFTNLAGALLTVDRATDAGVANIQGTFINAGTVLTGQLAEHARGILNQATFTNSGTIRIDSTSGHGIAHYRGLFTNSGQLIIGGSATVKDRGIYIIAPFVNTGSISLDRTIGYGLSVIASTLTNSGQITIGGKTPVKNVGVYNQASIDNKQSGVLRIDRTASHGIAHIAGSLTNAGQIIIGQTASVGATGIFNQATFDNQQSGILHIDGAASHGIAHIAGSLTNAGQIIIGQTASVGANGIFNQATFTNEAGGRIEIDRNTKLSGVENIKTFTNNGNIRVGAAGPEALSNQDGTFTNNACAVLTLFNRVINNSRIINAGFITVDSPVASLNDGTVKNNGVISYPQGNCIPDVTNNDVIIAPVRSCGSPILTNALQLGGNHNQFTIGTTWYTDQALSIPGGTYDQSTNSFTAASGLSVGSGQRLYFQATDNATACSQPVSISLTLNGPPSATLTASGPLTSPTTAVTLTATPGADQYVFSAGATQIGTGNTATVTAAGVYSVTLTAATGCSASASTTVTGGPVTPDLTVVVYALPTATYGTSPLSVVVDVVTLNASSTSGGITVKVSRDATCTLSLLPSATSVGGRLVQNGQWQLDSSDPAYYVLTTQSVIGGGGKLSFGLSGSLTPKATEGVLSISASLVGGSGGETNVVNNMDAEKINYFP